MRVFLVCLILGFVQSAFGQTGFIRNSAFSLSSSNYDNTDLKTYAQDADEDWVLLGHPSGKSHAGSDLKRGQIRFKFNTNQFRKITVGNNTNNDNFMLWHVKIADKQIDLYTGEGPDNIVTNNNAGTGLSVTVPDIGDPLNAYSYSMNPRPQVNFVMCPVSDIDACATAVENITTCAVNEVSAPICYDDWIDNAIAQTKTLLGITSTSATICSAGQIEDDEGTCVDGIYDNIAFTQNSHFIDVMEMARWAGNQPFKITFSNIATRVKFSYLKNATLGTKGYRFSYPEYNVITVSALPASGSWSATGTRTTNNGKNDINDMDISDQEFKWVTDDGHDTSGVTYSVSLYTTGYIINTDGGINSNVYGNTPLVDYANTRADDETDWILLGHPSGKGYIHPDDFEDVKTGTITFRFKNNQYKTMVVGNNTNNNNFVLWHVKIADKTIDLYTGEGQNKVTVTLDDIGDPLQVLNYFDVDPKPYLNFVMCTVSNLDSCKTAVLGKTCEYVDGEGVESAPICYEDWLDNAINKTKELITGCDGVLNSGLVNDECGVCGGSGIPVGKCDCNGNGIQEGKCDCDGNTVDSCGVCGGDSSTCVDACGVPNGDGSTCAKVFSDFVYVHSGSGEFKRCLTYNYAAYESTSDYVLVATDANGVVTTGDTTGDRCVTVASPVYPVRVHFEPTSVNITGVSDEDEFLTVVADEGNKIHVRLLADISLSSNNPIRIKDKNEVYIDGNGKKITVGSDKLESIIIRNSKNVVVKNLTMEGPGNTEIDFGGDDGIKFLDYEMALRVRNQRARDRYIDPDDDSSTTDTCDAILANNNFDTTAAAPEVYNTCYRMVGATDNTTNPANSILADHYNTVSSKGLRLDDCESVFILDSEFSWFGGSGFRIDRSTGPILLAGNKVFENNHFTWTASSGAVVAETEENSEQKANEIVYIDNDVHDNFNMIPFLRQTANAGEQQSDKMDKYGAYCTFAGDDASTPSDLNENRKDPAGECVTVSPTSTINITHGGRTSTIDKNGYDLIANNIAYGKVVDGSGIYVTRNKDSTTNTLFKFLYNKADRNGIGGIVCHMTDKCVFEGNIVRQNHLNLAAQNYGGIIINRAAEVTLENNYVLSHPTNLYGRDFRAYTNYALSSTSEATLTTSNNIRTYGSSDFGVTEKTIDYWDCQLIPDGNDRTCGGTFLLNTDVKISHLSENSNFNIKFTSNVNGLVKVRVGTDQSNVFRYLNFTNKETTIEVRANENDATVGTIANLYTASGGSADTTDVDLVNGALRRPGGTVTNGYAITYKPLGITGCMDNTRCNYDPIATVSGVCKDICFEDFDVSDEIDLDTVKTKIGTNGYNLKFTSDTNGCVKVKVSTTNGGNVFRHLKFEDGETTLEVRGGSITNLFTGNCTGNSADTTDATVLKRSGNTDTISYDIEWGYMGITGCMDNTRCNYDPLAKFSGICNDVCRDNSCGDHCFKQLIVNEGKQIDVHDREDLTIEFKTDVSNAGRSIKLTFEWKNGGTEYDGRLYFDDTGVARFYKKGVYFYGFNDKVVGYNSAITRNSENNNNDIVVLYKIINSLDNKGCTNSQASNYIFTYHGSNLNLNSYDGACVFTNYDGTCKNGYGKVKNTCVKNAKEVPITKDLKTITRDELKTELASITFETKAQRASTLRSLRRQFKNNVRSGKQRFMKFPRKMLNGDESETRDAFMALEVSTDEDCENVFELTSEGINYIVPEKKDACSGNTTVKAQCGSTSTDLYIIEDDGTYKTLQGGDLNENDVLSSLECDGTSYAVRFVGTATAEPTLLLVEESACSLGYTLKQAYTQDQINEMVSNNSTELNGCTISNFTYE